MVNYYSVLQVKQDANEDEIKKARRIFVLFFNLLLNKA